MISFKVFLSEAKKISPFPNDAHHPSLDIQPNKEFRFIRNTESSKKHTKHLIGDPFKQKIEPSGRYMQAITHDPSHSLQQDSRLESGTHKFTNPLYIHWGKSGLYHNEDNWKNRLTAHYGKKGKHLSQAIRDHGYDGIVTVGDHGKDQKHTSEVVDLTMYHPRGNK